MKIINTCYNLNGNINANIVLISDIHYYSKGDIKRLNIVLDNIKKINPKYICIPGDLIDEANIKDSEYLIYWLIKLSSISKVILSLGNHEFYMNKKDKIYGLNKVLFSKIGSIDNLYLLDNNNVIIDNINFIGLTLSMEYYLSEGYKKIDFTEYLNKIKTYKNYYNILLCHSPINICNEKVLNKYGLDLILCGHTHGGVTPRVLRPIFKNAGIVSPQKRLFIKTAYGHIKIYNTDIIITSGITILSHINKFRMFNGLFSPEIVSIDVANKSK